ncbi:MAG: hypothetical protein J7521_09435 [Caulobacter sp.]|nr:hypothetical protein [Caulobacter sp.]
MPDRIFMPLMALIGVAMIALSLVWPQGYGDRSPGPFGSTPIQQTPDMAAKIQREKDAAARHDIEARRAAETAGQQP